MHEKATLVCKSFFLRMLKELGRNLMPEKIFVNVTKDTSI